MSEYIVWHNPSCSKSRAACSELDGIDADVTLRLYKKDPPSETEISDVLVKLGLEPWDITRLKEPAAIDLGLAEWPRDETSRQRWISALASEPSLIERPIVIRGDRAAVARLEGWRNLLA